MKRISIARMIALHSRSDEASDLKSSRSFNPKDRRRL
jgi:hypothetical protein